MHVSQVITLSGPCLQGQALRQEAKNTSVETAGAVLESYLRGDSVGVTGTQPLTGLDLWIDRFQGEPLRSVTMTAGLDADLAISSSLSLDSEMSPANLGLYRSFQGLIQLMPVWLLRAEKAMVLGVWLHVHAFRNCQTLPLWKSPIENTLGTKPVGFFKQGTKNHFL